MYDKFRVLQALGAGEFAHLNGSLIAHLQGTYQLLRTWAASETLCDAGLFHAAYGTAGFDGSLISLDTRSEIANTIGGDAEALVYLYCCCDRDYTFPKITPDSFPFRDRFTGKEFELEPETARQFCELTVANELELVISSDEFKAKYGDELRVLFADMNPYLSEPAREAWDIWMSS
ncbi:hypothetical protein NF212_22680 [Parasalinivibrio latis]|uniref:DUF6817 domain-containing protein n=1 Tax=Parasalinivibrio latis TaxID=2952610 RepID=UPI0030E0A7F8